MSVTGAGYHTASEDMLVKTYTQVLTSLSVRRKELMLMNQGSPEDKKGEPGSHTQTENKSRMLVQVQALGVSH